MQCTKGKIQLYNMDKGDKLQLGIKEDNHNKTLNVKFHGYLLSSFTNCEQIIPFVAGAKHVRVGHTRGSGYLLL